MKTNRYATLIQEVKKAKPKIIMEIGVWKGDTAIKLINEALLVNNNVTYLGYDLFEELTQHIIKLEHCKPTDKPCSMQAIWQKLSKTKANIFLYKGFTRDTLETSGLKYLHSVDFVFLDGGHSLETINNDWQNIQKFLHKNSVIILDDYYKNKTDLGCKQLVDNLDRSKYKIELLEPIDEFLQKEGWIQYTQLVKVTLL